MGRGLRRCSYKITHDEEIRAEGELGNRRFLKPGDLTAELHRLPMLADVAQVAEHVLGKNGVASANLAIGSP